jgi:hypothetical protein
MPEEFAAIGDAWGQNVADAVVLECVAHMALTSLALASDLRARLRRDERGGVDSSGIIGSPQTWKTAQGG